ncbi:MAG TPA: ester cyclase [Mucilaginibacter sp.]|jgi:predicted SnoaL-like aldol condensation-catalyzing enzyme
MEQKSNKTIVLECYRKIIRDLDLSIIDTYIKEDYIQHSPTVKTGRAGILEMLTFLKTLPKPAAISPSPIIRVIAEGDFVAVHLDVRFMGKRMAVVDLYRLENGQLAEHWDAGQVQPGYNDSAITMTNGITVIEESADRIKNKKLVTDFYSELIPGNVPEAGKFLTPAFIEHSPDGELLTNRGRKIKIHRIIGEGNFIMTQCECNSEDKTFAQYNIFKIEDDKIAEHWSVEQEVPTAMAHSNRMF